MRVLAEDQYNELTEHIKQLEAENQYLKKLLDDAGIPYDKPDNNSEIDEPSVVSIKEEPITKELVQLCKERGHEGGALSRHLLQFFISSFYSADNCFLRTTCRTFGRNHRRRVF